jgi:6-phosphogluconolactonase
MMKNVNVFASPLETVITFAHYLMEILTNGENLNIAFSGGSTPKILFDYLAKKQAQSKAWSKLYCYWGDERCVPPSDQDSNYKMTREHLLDKIEIPKNQIHRIHGEDDPYKEAQRYSGLLSKNIPLVNNVPAIDLVILGMGDDGHTASIFPNQMHLLDSKNICDVAEHPVSGQKRITLSGRTINNAKEIIFLVTGDKKKEKVFEILKQSGDWQKYPAAHIEPRNGKISWFLDNSAGELL